MTRHIPLAHRPPLSQHLRGFFRRGDGKIRTERRLRTFCANLSVVATQKSARTFS